MRIAISSDGGGMEGYVSEHFGRCPEFVIVESEGKEIKKMERVDNPYFNNHIPGEVPKFISSLGVKLMITGGMGPRAIEMFESLGVEVIVGVSGKIKEVVERYLKGELKADENICRH
ncbi:MAG: NifB/NifX family molybdenum-iron cluster-binding protein [Candidatus Micrarchaeia archaeon]